MTTAPLEYQSPQSPRQFEWPGMLAWAVIIACTGYVMYRNVIGYQKLNSTPGANPSNQIQVDVAGRAAVGFKQMIDAGTGGNGGASNMSNLVNGMQQNAKSPNEKVRALIVTAEVVSRDQAIKDIDALTQSQSAFIDNDVIELREAYSDPSVKIDDATADRLRDRYGFFGRLAATTNRPANDPERGAVLDEAKGAATRLIIVGILGVGLLVVIGAAFITAIVLAASGKIKLAFIPQPRANSAYIEAFAIYLGGFLLLSLVYKHFDNASLAWEWFALIFIPISMFWIQHRGEASDLARFGLGWYAGRGAWIEIPMGIFAYLACAPIVFVGFMISLYLSRAVGTTPMHPIQQMLNGSRWELVNLFGIACLMAPVLEETMFRGAMFNHLRRRWNWLVSAPTVAFFFAAIHPQGWTMIPALGSIAIVLAAIREWRGTALASMAAHATNNGIVLALAVMATR